MKLWADFVRASADIIRGGLQLQGVAPRTEGAKARS